MWRDRVLAMLRRRVFSDSRYRLHYGPWALLGTVSSSALLIGYLQDDEKRLETRFQQHVLCEASSPLSLPPPPAHMRTMRRRQTFRQMKEKSTKQSVESRYLVDWKQKPLGSGSFGVIYLATDRRTGRPVALKKISKKHTSNDTFLREMSALLHIQAAAGGHPNICSLIEHFDEGEHFYLILDLVSGGELFDHLVEQGAYSERAASRLIQEIAGALVFLHGLKVTHGDLKPENLMLSTKHSTDAVIQLVDFGCAVVEGVSDDEDDDGDSSAGKTLAYCPPEQLEKGAKMHPSMDIWALGVILYIMLTGAHPFDLSGTTPDEEVAEMVRSGKRPPPLRNSAITVHLSESAIDLMEKCMERDPNKRITAAEILEHPWVKGDTAKDTVMTDIDKKLSLYRRYKSQIEHKVFKEFIEWSDDDQKETSKRTSLIERSFRAFDPAHKGYITQEDMRKATKSKDKPNSASTTDQDEEDDTQDDDSAPLSLTGFSDLLAENMKSRYFPTDHVIYREGDIGNHMYFINSGAVWVETAGSRVKRGPGDFFGEGALLDPKRKRSATIRCATPVHAFEISRDFFEKNLSQSDPELVLTLREKDKIRKRNRAKLILRLQKSLVPHEYHKGEVLFAAGQEGDSLFLIEHGLVDIVIGENKKHVFTATPGNICGENSLIMNRRRNATAICASDEGCKVLKMMAPDFRKLTEMTPDIVNSLRDLCLRRDIKKAVVLRLRKEFPYHNPREAFDSIRDPNDGDKISVKAIGRLLRELDPEFTDEEVLEVVKILDSTNSGYGSFEEFKKIFIADPRKSAAV